MKKFIYFTLLLSIISLTACNGKVKTEASYPDSDPNSRRREQVGSLTGGGIKLFGGKSKKSSDSSSKDGSGIGVNSYLWRASLDSLSFMPLASADPFGGVIITDWYEDPKTKGERFKINVMILDTELKTSALKVSIFKQVLAKGNQWRDSEVAKETVLDIENKILTRARELKVKKEIGT